MKQLLLLAFLNFLFINVLSYQCVFDKLYSSPKVRQERLLTLHENNQSMKSKDQLLNQVQSQPRNHKRLLQTVTKQSIRITLDKTNLSTITPATNAENTTYVNLNYIKRSMQVAERFFQLRLKVAPVARITSPDVCAQFETIANDRSYGISNSDLHIYVRYITVNSTLKTYGATGISCKVNSNSGVPDLDFSHGRPIVGRIQFNTFTIIDRKIMTNRLFSSITATSLHEIIHILGFDSLLYSTYLDSNGNYYSSTTQQLSSALVSPSRPTTYVLTTPHVTAWAKDFFACSTIPGMILENQEGIGSHWQRTAMYDQLMTGTSLGAQKGISGLTYALLKDMGWYQVDDSLNDTSNYGYHKGCSFLLEACYSSTTFSEFCSNPSDISLCASNYLGKAICSTASELWGDGCGMYGSYMNCVDQTTSDEGYTSQTLQKFGVNAFCVYSTYSLVSIPSIYKSRCYTYTCQESDESIRFTVGTSTVTCSSVLPTQPILSSMIGTLTCPSYSQFCQQSRKFCTNWCSKNGFCTGGICHCLNGYYGKDCSITSCVTGQYYDESSRQCVTVCPSKTYTSQFSKACLPCDSVCEQCRDQPHICIKCISTLANPQYQYNTLCYSACPEKTFTAGDFCKDCDQSTSFCHSCQIISTNCTSCSSGKYLDNPDYGACVDDCTVSPYIRKDVVNFKCVQSCTQNLIQVGTTCDLCAVNTYKYIATSSCISNCPEKYYQDATQRLCVQCDSSCLQCDGSYPENCTKCSLTATQKYLLLKMCSASCPSGYYADEVAGTCEPCPDANCVTCAYNSTSNSAYCKSCIYDYYLQPTNTCEQTCPTYYFLNPWNHTCDACDSGCGNCYSADPTACTSCRAGSVFLVNFTGGFCLTACPTQNYVTSGSNCLQCHETCLTCSGTNSNDCSSCINSLYLYSGLCRYVCPPGSYADDSILACQYCHTNCKHCFGTSQNQCTKCNTGLYLNNHTCTDRCPDNRRQNAWSVCYSQNMINFLIISIIILAISI